MIKNDWICLLLASALQCSGRLGDTVGYRQRSWSEISTPLGTGERPSAGRVVERASSPALLDNMKKSGVRCATSIQR